MSFAQRAPALIMDLDIDGDDALVDALRNAPGLVRLAAERAGRQAIDVVTPAIETATPIKSGDLLGSESVFLSDPFHVTFTAGMYYASFVEDRQHFLERAVAWEAAEIEAIYDHVFDDFAASFGSEQ